MHLLSKQILESLSCQPRITNLTVFTPIPTQTSGSVMSGGSKTTKSPRVNRVTTTLFRVNHQIYHEASACLYRSKNIIAVALMQLQTLSEFSQMPAALERCQMLDCQGPPERPIVESFVVRLEELERLSRCNQQRLSHGQSSSSLAGIHVRELTLNLIGEITSCRL